MLSVCLKTATTAGYADTMNRIGLSMGVFFFFYFIAFYSDTIDMLSYDCCCE